MKFLKSKKGMTVIEIVVSLAILGLISVGFTGFFTDSFKFQARNQETVSIQKVAEETMEKLKTNRGRDLTIGLETVNITTISQGSPKILSDDNYEYKIEINEIKKIDKGSTFYDITISVNSKDDKTIAGTVNSTVQVNSEDKVDESTEEFIYIRYYDDKTLLKEEKFYSGSYLVTSYIPSKHGNIFTGWVDDSNYPYSAGKEINFDGETVFGEEYSLYAVWETVVPGKYMITYNANGGSGTMNPQTVTSGQSVALTTNTFTRTNYKFLGWSTDSSATSATYTDGQTITPTADMTLYAVWQVQYTLTLTYNANGGSGAPSAQTYTGTLSSNTFTISTTEPTPPSGKAFRGWSTSGGSATVAEYKVGARIEININTTLYAVYVTPLASGDLFTGSDVGAYVTYTPSSTSYKVSSLASISWGNQTYNPSSYTNWRVFSNDGTNVEIISDESVGDLHLQGETGYVNAVQILQDMAAAYVNSIYATSARSLGYSENGLTEDEITNYKTINTTTYSIAYGIDQTTFPYTDTQYSTDQTVIRNNGLLGQNSREVWVASRKVYTGSVCSSFFVNIMYSNGFVGGSNNALEYVQSDGRVDTQAPSHGVRPIVTLKSGLKVASGDGSPSNPYVLAEPVATYTITYNANGGSGTMATQTVTEGVSVALNTNAFTKNCHNFLGWSTSIYSIVEYTDGQVITPTGDLNLYAVWEDGEHEGPIEYSAGESRIYCNHRGEVCATCRVMVWSANDGEHQWSNGVCTNCGYECGHEAIITPNGDGTHSCYYCGMHENDI